ncbi:hypothetical protein PG997_011211 [Apiospora hydei]|uniref:Uncharacterized protein n=1 Tax=Apiospora hydei TaxID=1337664 RepID=A0ABR1VID8_9PEZI
MRVQLTGKVGDIASPESQIIYRLPFQCGNRASSLTGNSFWPGEEARPVVQYVTIVVSNGTREGHGEFAEAAGVVNHVGILAVTAPLIFGRRNGSGPASNAGGSPPSLSCIGWPWGSGRACLDILLLLPLLLGLVPAAATEEEEQDREPDDRDDTNNETNLEGLGGVGVVVA